MMSVSLLSTLDLWIMENRHPEGLYLWDWIKTYRQTDSSRLAEVLPASSNACTAKRPVIEWR